MAIMIQIKRPNGEIEWVNATEALGFTGMTQPMLQQIRAQTRKAGGGEVLGWEHRSEMAEWETALAEVEQMEDAAERARDYPARYLSLAADAEQARREWEAQYPDESEAHYRSEREAAARRRAPAPSDPHTN